MLIFIHNHKICNLFDIIYYSYLCILHRKNANSEAKGIEMKRNAIGQFVPNNDIISQVKEAFDQKEGCVIKGYFNLNRVKSKFTVNGDQYKQLLHMTGNTLNLTHTIKHLSFGRRTHVYKVENQFKGRYGELSPLNDHTQIYENYGSATNYNLNIVPTTYHDRIGFKYPVFQFAYGIGFENDGSESVNFDLSIKGVTVNYYLTADSLLQFLTQI